LALRNMRPTSGDLLVKKLGDVTGGVYGAPRYAAELGTLRRLDDARWINWGEDLAHIAWAQLVADRVPAARIVLRTSHLGAQLAAASAGVGVLLCDPQTARVCGLVDVRLSPALRRSLPPTSGGELWLVVHRALREVPRIAAVWRFLEAAAHDAGLHI
jgi:DNA-binding transcriptional LysR family regulator